MSNQPKSKRALTWGLAAVVLIALVLAVGVAGGRGGSEGAAEEAQAQQASASDTSGQAASASAGDAGPLTSQAPPHEERAPMPRCWAEMQKLDQTLTLENFRAALAKAVASEDQYLMVYLEGRLTRMVGNDAQTALKVLSWAVEVGGGLELVVYMEALKKAPAVQNSKVSERLLQLAENPKGSVALRAASVIGLETQKRFDAAALKRMKAIALDESQDQVAWNATRTIGRVMETDYKSTGNHKAYWEQLLDISRKSEERGVRGLALEMPTYAHLIVDEQSIETLSEIMQTGRDRELRELAAMRLSLSEAPDKALEAYQQAFGKEAEFCVRWALFRYALRAAGAKALPMLQQFAMVEPRFQRDYIEFQEIYAQGVMDFERVWNEKTDHHVECMDSHPEGH